MSVKILHFAEAEKEPLSRKILGKASQNALGKGTGPSNLPDTAVGIFLSRLKKWVQKSPEVVETSGLFAAASFWVQLDGKSTAHGYNAPCFDGMVHCFMGSGLMRRDNRDRKDNIKSAYRTV